MAGDDLKKVVRGQPLRIPAAAFNSFIDAAKDYRNRTLGLNANPRELTLQSGILYVRNDSGEDQDQFSVLGLDDIVINPQDNEPEFRARVVLSGKIPAKDKHRGRFCILTEPVEAGKIAKAYVDGISQVRLLVHGEAEECNSAEIDDGLATHLKAASYGSATILWREGGTSEQWAVVRLGKLPPVFPVKLEKAGGAQGTETNAATWTYNVLDPATNEVLAEGVNPTSSPHKWKRPSVGWMAEAIYGLARFTGQGGDISLGWINEMVDQEKCGG